MGSQRSVAIRTDAIELSALLKWANIVTSGGEAKQLIQGGRVQVNGEIERRRGRKIVLGDYVAVNGEVIVVTKP